MDIDEGIIRALCPNLQRPEDWVEPLSTALSVAACYTPQRAAAFLANAAHESAQFTRLVENLNYSAEGLRRTWPARFTPAIAESMARQPVRIANFVYADRMGNAGIESGDGWRYRGRGIFQITGRANYRACSLSLFNGDGKVLQDAPELLETPEHAAMSAAWYWTAMQLNEKADTGRFDAVTDAINLGRQTAAVGDAVGYQDRLAYFNKASSLLA